MVVKQFKVARTIANMREDNANVLDLLALDKLVQIQITSDHLLFISRKNNGITNAKLFGRLLVIRENFRICK